MSVKKKMTSVIGSQLQPCTAVQAFGSHQQVLECEPLVSLPREDDGFKTVQQPSESTSNGLASSAVVQ